MEAESDQIIVVGCVPNHWMVQWNNLFSSKKRCNHNCDIFSRFVDIMTYMLGSSPTAIVRFSIRFFSAIPYLQKLPFFIPGRTLWIPGRISFPQNWHSLLFKRNHFEKGRESSGAISFFQFFFFILLGCTICPIEAHSRGLKSIDFQPDSEARQHQNGPGTTRTTQAAPSQIQLGAEWCVEGCWSFLGCHN